METTTHQVLEINLISAQGLVEPSVKHRHHMKTFAVVWIDPSTKLHTQVDCVGAQNPTWNDTFLFKVSPHFLLGKTSAVSVEIYAVGFFRHKLIGSVRVLISNFLPIASADAMKTHAFGAYLIRNPSGNSFGILNIGGMVRDASAGFQALTKVSGIDYHYFTGENLDGKRHLRTNNIKFKVPVRDILKYIACGFVDDNSEANDSLTSSLSLKGRKEDIGHGVLPPDKEIVFEEDQKEEIFGVNMEAINLVPHEIGDQEVISDNERSLVKMGKDVKMMMEEKKKLREMVEMLMLVIKGQSTVISDLSGRVKTMERKLLRRNKYKKPHYRRMASATNLSDHAALGKPSV
ncbi:hypothetical protein REPUB_Repub09cG0010100 [Reevesia pubescens]